MYGHHALDIRGSFISGILINGPGRYSHRALPSVYAAFARSAGVEPDQVLAGTGSTEILHCAIYAFTSPKDAQSRASESSSRNHLIAA